MNLSSYFNIEKKELEELGVLDIDVFSDIPLFIDPLLLLNNNDLPKAYEHFQNFMNLERNIIKTIDFVEVNNTHLGYSVSNSCGNGMGNREVMKVYARNIFKEVGLETIRLFSFGIAEDKLSDFTTTLILDDLLEYTENITKELDIESKKICIDYFNHNYNMVVNNNFVLPYVKETGTYIIMVPKSIVRETNILTLANNYKYLGEIAKYAKSDIVKQRITNIISSKRVTSTDKNRKDDILEEISELLVEFPELARDIKDFDVENIHYFDDKNGHQSLICIQEVANVMVKSFNAKGDMTNSFAIASELINNYKHCLENTHLSNLFHDGQLFYEKYQQLAFQLSTANITTVMIDAEVNNGLGPCDFKICVNPADCTIIDFKISKNFSEKSTIKQLTQYMVDNKSNDFLCPVVCFNEEQYENALGKINKVTSKYRDRFIIIKCYKNKKSASKL